MEILQKFLQYTSSAKNVVHKDYRIKVLNPHFIFIGIMRKIMNTKTFLRDSYSPSKSLAKFLSDYNNDITMEDLQQHCLLDETKRETNNASK